MKVLVIEDNPDHALIERLALERELKADVAVEADAEAGLARLRRDPFDIVLLDYHLPGQDGLDVLRRIKEGRGDLPVILVTAAGSEEVAVAAMKQGASDYLVKRFGRRGELALAASVRRSLEQAELARAYRRSQELHRRTLELAWDGIAYMSLRTRKIAGTNAALRRMLDVADGELDGKPVEALFAAEDRATGDRIVSFLDEAAPGNGEKRCFEVEARLAQKRGGAVLAELRAVEAEVDGERVALLTIRDVTERRRLEEQLVQAQKMEAVGTLAGGIAHDFNNLLGAILGYASYLKRHIQPGDRLFRSVQTIESASERAAELVRRLLSFSRRGPSERRPFNVNLAIEDTERLLARTVPKSIEVRTELAQDLPAVDGDETEIQQVLLNVSLNARDAIQDAGVITIRSRLAEPSEAPPGTSGPGPARPFVSVTVTDTGAGMTREAREHCFEPFFTTKGPGKGTGLGLATAYAIVKAHGGAIEISSEPGHGSQVRIFLPASEWPAPPRALEAATDRAGTGTVLVIDDEAAIRDLTTDILEERGYAVILAASGDEALSIFEQRRQDIDLVILDMIMPGRDGLATMRRIRELDPDARVLLSSGYSPEGSRARAMSDGALGFIQKPYRVTELCAAVRQALAGPAR